MGIVRLHILAEKLKDKLESPISSLFQQIKQNSSFYKIIFKEKEQISHELTTIAKCFLRL